MKRAQSPIKAVKSGQFRIIAGLWRSRRFSFPAIDGLRPTPDRVKETLFNWLEPEIRGANCLDLYAGSGCLGLEALSRGAASCVFIEQNKAACDAIKEHCQLLQANAQVQQGVLPEALCHLKKPLDIIFLDPPYALESHQACIEILLKNQCIKDNALIYCENSSSKAIVNLGANFTVHRHKIAGEVQYTLLRYQALSDGLNSL